ncbi:MAG: hypothetical protein HND52_12095 [Ignavibacteriae bacterium]|nr:hypothetical protein [Ignavibacteriota bacterium]NOG98693.1 hypothetical protein [Ignavibacteriota bacterium]
MKKILSGILLIALLPIVITAQQQNKIEIVGGVSYKSSQNVYVKFSSTKGIGKGDTLFQKKSNKLIPVLIVKFLSSTSCAGELINGDDLKVGDKIIALVEFENKKMVEEVLDEAETNSYLIKEQTNETAVTKAASVPWFSGKLSVSSYSQVSNLKNDNSNQRWRYRLAMNGDNIENSKLSFSSYFVFSYRADEWSEAAKDLSRSLKVYNLGVKYDYANTGSVWLGRGINRNASNIGAIDGLQVEQKFGSYLTGAILGSRPDFGTYGLNLKLAQFGVFVSREDTVGSVNFNNSLAFFEQTNDFKTDRRFIYFQHRNKLSKAIRVFLSSEIDVFKIKNGSKKNELTLTNLYLSLRYSPLRWLSFSTSYDARKNVIYFETFKSYTDSLLDVSTRQGVKLRTRIKIFDRLNLNAGFGYRQRSDDIKPSRNMNGALSYSGIPLIQGTANVSYTYLTTSYVRGKIFGARYANDFFEGLLNTSVRYRNVEYEMQSYDYKYIQNIISFDLSLRAFDNLYLSTTYEGTFQSTTTYTSFYINASTRF